MSANGTPPRPRTQSGGGDVSFADTVAFLSRNAVLIAAVALGCAVVTALVVILFVPRHWEASATLVVVPPKFSSELKPGTLTIQAYQALLESDAVVSEAKSRLVAEKVLAPSDHFRVGHELFTRIFVSRRAEETTLAPMLQAIAQGESPQQAETMANTWVQVFLQRAQGLMAGTTSLTVQFIDQQYPEARDRLTGLENQRVAATDAFQKRYDEAALRWSSKLTGYGMETADRIAKFKGETQALLEKFMGDRSLEVRRAQLKSLRDTYSTLQAEQAQVTSLLQQKQLQLQAAKAQIAQTQPYLTLHKAITDQALWDAVTARPGAEPDWKALKDHVLVSQEENPVYTEIATRATKLEMEVNALDPRAAQLSTELDELATRMKGLDSGVRTDEASLEALKEQRKAGLENLQAEREDGLAALKRQQAQELDAIQRERDARLGQLGRDVDQQSKLYSELAKNYNQAVLAKAQQDVEDVRLAAPAVAPESPMARGGLFKALMALILGGLAGGLIGYVREVKAKEQP